MQSVISHPHGSRLTASLAATSGAPTAVLPAYCLLEKPRASISDVILLADDDISGQMLGRHILEREGYEVMVASNGLEALDALKQRLPGLVLLDVEMPGQSGFEVCQKLKADPRWAEIPVIFLTAETAPHSKARGFSLGGADYVTKPIEPIELIARIKCHLELAAHRHDLNCKVRLYKDVAADQLGRLQQVRQGQTSMLTSPAAMSGFDVAVRLATANEAGGDFYEISRLSETQFGFLVADVAGHDLTLPFVTGGLKALCGLCLSECLTPEETMALLNSGLARILSKDRFVTACYAKVDQESRSLTVINAGHPPALIQRHPAGHEYLHSIGDVLGMYDQVRFDALRTQVKPGDRLFLYTDGLIEGYRDEKGRGGRQAFGMRRFAECVEPLRSRPLTEVVDTVLEQLIVEGAGTLGDDVVLLAMEFWPELKPA